MDAANGIKSRREKRFNIGGAAAAKKDAKSGYWAGSKTKPKTKENVFKDGYNLHIQREQSKSDWRSAQIANGKRTLEVMEKIGNSLNCMSMTDKDYYADFKDYVFNDYNPESARFEIIRMSKDNKDEFIDYWRVAVRKNYSKNKRDESIKRIFDFLKNNKQ